MLKKEVLKDIIETMIDDLKNTDIEKTGIDIIGYEYVFPIRCLYVADNIVITFGGYALHFEIFNIEDYGIEEIIEKFIEYIKGYENITLDKCKIKYNVDSM